MDLQDFRLEIVVIQLFFKAKLTLEAKCSLLCLCAAKLNRPFPAKLCSDHISQLSQHTSD